MAGFRIVVHVASEGQGTNLYGDTAIVGFHSEKVAKEVARIVVPALRAAYAGGPAQNYVAYRIQPEDQDSIPATDEGKCPEHGVLFEYFSPEYEGRRYCPVGCVYHLAESLWWKE